MNPSSRTENRKTSNKPENTPKPNPVGAVEGCKGHFCEIQAKNKQNTMLFSYKCTICGCLHRERSLV